MSVGTFSIKPKYSGRAWAGMRALKQLDNWTSIFIVLRQVAKPLDPRATATNVPGLQFSERDLCELTA